MNEDNVQFVKPEDKKYNRRSSFFRRSLSSNSYIPDSPSRYGVRATLPAQGDVASVEEDIQNEYLDKLKKEKEDWKDLSDRMRKREEELRDKFPHAASSEDFLTAEDKKFLAERPDYSSIGRLLDSVTEVVAIKQRRIDRTMERVDSFVTHCEEVTIKLAASVIDHFMEDFDEFGEGAPSS